MSSRASQCAASLRMSPGGDRTSQSENLISTALSLISQTARFVEEKAREDPALGVLSLAVLAKTKTDPESDVNVFRLWGPRLRPLDALEQNVHPREDAASVAEQQESQGANLDETDCEQNTPCTLVQDTCATRDISHTTEIRLIEQTANALNQVLHIEDKITAKCLSLLLDASGITTHPSCHRNKSHTHIPAPVLRTALRNMMTEYKRRNGDAAKDAKYSSLLPFELRDRQVSFSSLSLMRTNSGFHVSGSPVTTLLTVKKPDRNKKHVHFAMFAALLQIDPDGICSKALQSLASRGFGPSGCSLKPGVNCGGPKVCSEAFVRPLSRFFNESNEVIGSGEVYPSVSYLDGELLPQDMVMVRFSSFERDFADMDTRKFYKWRSHMVSRSELLDAYGTTVGTAIVATYAIHEEGRKIALPASDLDMSKAVVVCDVRINATRTTERYCFSEWYSFGSDIWREVYDPCTLNAAAPRTLGEFERFPCGFWHDNYLKEVPLEN